MTLSRFTTNMNCPFYWTPTPRLKSKEFACFLTLMLLPSSFSNLNHFFRPPKNSVLLSYLCYFPAVTYFELGQLLLCTLQTPKWSLKTDGSWIIKGHCDHSAYSGNDHSASISICHLVSQMIGESALVMWLPHWMWKKTRTSRWLCSSGAQLDAASQMSASDLIYTVTIDGLLYRVCRQRLLFLHTYAYAWVFLCGSAVCEASRSKIKWSPRNATHTPTCRVRPSPLQTCVHCARLICEMREEIATRVHNIKTRDEMIYCP